MRGKSKNYTFASSFANEMCAYFELRASQDHKHDREKHILISLDEFLCVRNIVGKELNPATIESWLQSLSEIHVNTKIVYISHYTQFAKYLHTLGYKAFIPERPMEDRTYAPYVFTEDEIARLLEAADNLQTRGNPSIPNIQFPIILRILYGCGLRADEALRLLVSDVDTTAGVLLIRNGKGNKDRLVPMDATLSAIVKQYISYVVRGRDENSLLFLNRNKEQIAQATFRYWFVRALAAAGIEKPDLPRMSRNICVHCIRHTFAVHSFRKQDRAGVDMYSAAPFLSTFMGHTKLYGTETYLHMSAENSADIIEKSAEYTQGLFPEVPR